MALLYAFIGARRLLGAAGLRDDQHLLLHCVRGVFFSVFFGIAPGEPKDWTSLSKKRPGHVVNVPGVHFYACAIITPRGAFTNIITVEYTS